LAPGFFWSLARRIQLGVSVLGAELLSNWNWKNETAMAEVALRENVAVFCEIDEGKARLAQTGVVTHDSRGYQLNTTAALWSAPSIGVFSLDPKPTPKRS
jgi:hypothetical protein